VSAPARFITFEGIDGAGKSSHIEAVAQALEQAGHRLLRTREPGGTALAERLRELFLHERMDALTEALLVFGARRDHLVRCIEPALAEGRTVLCDRFTDATFAYQGAGRGFDLAVLGQLESWVQQGRQPDLTLWFDVAPEIAAARRAGARAPDRLESEERLLRTCARRLRGARSRRPGRFVRIDAGQSLEAVRADVLATVRARTAAPGARRRDAQREGPALAGRALAAWRDGQRGHALILHGGFGSGLFELALRLAQAWLCEQPPGPCDQCPSCHLVLARTHTDLRVVMPETWAQTLQWGASEEANRPTAKASPRRSPAGRSRSKPCARPSTGPTAAPAAAAARCWCSSRPMR
jgi:dTMP kinase